MITTDIYNYLISLVASHPVLITFFTGFFGGEEFLLLLSFASANGIIPFYFILIFFSIGAFIMDMIIFLIGRTRVVKKLHGWKLFSDKYQKVDMLVGRLTKDRHILLLFYTKFIYGTRIASIIFLGLKGVKFAKFVIVSAFTIFVWVGVVASIGWLAGKGFNIILTLFKSVFLAISFLFFFIIIIYLVKKWIEKRIIKSGKE